MEYGGAKNGKIYIWQNIHMVKIYAYIEYMVKHFSFLHLHIFTIKLKFQYIVFVTNNY